jgi:hypothetical protein
MVTSLPGGPYPGQEVVLTDSLSAPTWRWRLWYNADSASAYKWEYIGGPPKVAYNLSTSDAQSSAGAWAFLANSPTLTVPNAGDYLVTAFSTTQNNAATLCISYMGVDVASSLNPATTPNPGGSLPALNPAETSQSFLNAPLLGLSAGVLLRMVHYLSASSVLVGARGRSLAIVPQRVA